MRDKHNDKIKLKGKSGVYQITIGDEIYVGSSKNLYNRYISHIRYCKKQNHYNQLIQNAFDKEQDFQFDILEFCDNRLDREQYYIDRLKPNLNICQYAESSIGYKHSKEIINRLKEINKDIANRPEVKEKTKATQFKKGQKPSQKTIEINRKRMSKPTIDLETGIIYDSLKEACELTNHNRKTQAVKICLKQKCRFQYL